jgi:hypothetical protein
MLQLHFRTEAFPMCRRRKLSPSSRIPLQFLIEELRSAGHLSAMNLLFLAVRRLAGGHHGDAILTHRKGPRALVGVPRGSAR